jgi:hypothetical protein
MAPKISTKLKDATKDLKYLLDRGYRKKIALNFVGNHYLLNQNERNYLGRCVFSEITSQMRQDKITNIKSISGNTVFIDGYNVLITVETILINPEKLIIAQDGLVRDTSAVFGKYKIKKETIKSMNLILNTLKTHKPSFVKFYLDKQVSFSGELVKMIIKFLESHEIPGNAVVSQNVDYELVQEWKEKGGLVATSDGAVIDKVNNIIDIPLVIIKKEVS